MALNFSHRPLFSAHLSEENLVSPMRIANGYQIVEANSGRQEKVMEDCFDYGRDESQDIVDLLPSDPFGMDISSTFTAITSWLGDLEVDYGGYSAYGYRGGDTSTSEGSYKLFTDLNFIWNNAMKFQAFPGNMSFGCQFINVGGFGVGEGVGEKLVEDTPGYGGDGVGVVSDCIMEDVFITEDDNGVGGKSLDGRSGQCREGSKVCSSGDAGAPHSAFVLALGCLGVRDLLVVETVCKSLRSTIRSDSLLWRSIHIDQPLNEKITDDNLLSLTSRAHGNLQCLSLVECPRITDDALKQVLDNNTRLSKLSVPGCSRLSVEGILTSLKACKASGRNGVKQLRIGGIYGVTLKHFEELNVLLGTNCLMEQSIRKPHFYHRGNFYLSCEDDRKIDIEMCPICQNLRLVYDCPQDSCRRKEHPTQMCRGCTLCIARCVRCGRCINDSEYMETFSLELLCSDCFQFSTRQEKLGAKIRIQMAPPCSLRLHG